MKSEPTARPWKYTAYRGDITAPSVLKEQSRTASGMYGEANWEYYGAELVAESVGRPDGDLIVRAVNAHDALVEACEAAERYLAFSGPACAGLANHLRTVLNLARGEA